MTMNQQNQEEVSRVPWTLSIDPSINNLGWAVFKGSQLIASGTVQSYTSSKDRVEARLRAAIDILGEVIESTLFAGSAFADFCAVIEKPQMWGAYKSVASSHSGSLLQLHITVGALWCYLDRLDNCEGCFLIPVSEWKGQLPKRITTLRMEKKYNKKFKTDDEADAVGIGDYFVTKKLKGLKDGERV